MIHLKRYSLVFVKIPKCASEAIALYLQQAASTAEDVFTLDNNFSQNLSEPHVRHCHMDVRYMLQHKLCDNNNTFIGVVRNPAERLLSLYLYRQRQQRYDTSLSVEDFRQRASSGYIADHSWHTQLQSTFLLGATTKEYWCYNNLSNHITELRSRLNLKKADFQIINNSSSTKTSELLSTFYDERTLSAVTDYWKDDFLLYNEIKHGTPGLD